MTVLSVAGSTLSDRRLCRGMRFHFNLEDLRPLLAGDEEPVALGIIGDAIQYRFLADALVVGQQVGQIDPTYDVAIAWRDAGDAVRVPYVGVNLSLDVLELIEQVD